MKAPKIHPSPLSLTHPSPARSLSLCTKPETAMDHPPNSPAKTFYFRNLFIFPLSLAFIVHSLFFTLPDLFFPSASKINRLITNLLFFQFPNVIINFYYRNLVLFSLHLVLLVQTVFSTNLLDLLSPFAVSKINTSYSTFHLISTHPILFQFSHLISLLIFPLLSNIIINSSTVSNPRLLITHYFWASLTMYAYNAIAIGHLFIILAASSNAVLLFAAGASFFLFLSTDDVSLWRRFMGSVFEPVSTVAAVKKSSRVIWVVNGIFMYLLMGALLFPKIGKN